MAGLVEEERKVVNNRLRAQGHYRWQRHRRPSSDEKAKIWVIALAGCIGTLRVVQAIAIAPVGGIGVLRRMV